MNKTIRMCCALGLTALLGWGAEGGSFRPVRFSTDNLNEFMAQGPAAATQEEIANSGYKINIVKSEAQNNLRKGRATKAVVEVRDRNKKPVAGALVLFALPGSGPSGTFAGAAQTMTVTTNAAGQAVATYTPNQVAGMFSLNVSAQVNGSTVATSTISQVNVGVAAAAGAGAGISGTMIGVIVGVAAAAAVGIGLAVANSGDSAPPVVTPVTPAAPPSVRIGGGGTPVFGPQIFRPGLGRTR